MKTLLLTFTTLTLATVSLLAQPKYDCDSPFVDNAAVVKDNLPIHGAIEKLRANGADAYVRILQGLNQPSMEKEFQAWIAACPTWQDKTGHRIKNNAVLLFFAMNNRLMGLRYGSIWDGKIGNKWVDIEAQDIRPNFKAGDYTDGVVAGLNSLTKLTRPDSDSSAAIWFWVFGVIGVGGIIGIILIIRSNRKDEAQQKAQSYSDSSYGSHCKKQTETMRTESGRYDNTSSGMPCGGYAPSAKYSYYPPQPPQYVYDPASDLINPLNPLSPLSPFNPVNEENRELREELREERREHYVAPEPSYRKDPDPEPDTSSSSSAWDFGSSDSSSSFDSGGGGFDSGSGGDSGW